MSDHDQLRGDQQTVNLLRDAGFEIEHLRARVAALQPRADAYTTLERMVALMGGKDNQADRAYGLDIVWSIKSHVETIEAGWRAEKASEEIRRAVYGDDESRSQPKYPYRDDDDEAQSQPEPARDKCRGATAEQPISEPDGLAEVGYHIARQKVRLDPTAPGREPTSRASFQDDRRDD